MAQIHKLSPLFVERSKKLGWHADGGGLYLRIRDGGSRSWMFRYSQAGQRREFAIGPARDYSLGEARDLAAACRKAVLEGRDPKTEITAAAGDKTFLDAARAIIERRQKSWKSDKTAIKWRRGLMEHAAPLHHMNVDQITVADVEAVIRPIWYSMNHSARGTRGMIEQALDLATVLGWRDGDNPARWKGALEFLLPDHKPPTQHHTALPYAELPAFFAALIESHHETRFALGLTILTASRGHMVRHADWSEFDLDHRLWTVPASRMKKSEDPHIVPLTDAMIALLPAAGQGLVYPYRGKGFSENAFRSTLRAMGYKATAHGFRSTFKDWAADTTDYPDEVSELALAHQVGSRVRRAYRRGKGLDVRRSLLQDWCDYAAGGKASI